MIPHLCSFAYIDLHANHKGQEGLTVDFRIGSCKDWAALDLDHNHNHWNIVHQTVIMPYHLIQLIAPRKAWNKLNKTLSDFGHKCMVHHCLLPH